MADRGPITCFVADDHPPIVQAVRFTIADAGHKLIGTAREGHEAVAKILRMQPAVAIVDIRMPGLDGLSVAREVLAELPGTAVILYTAAADRALLGDALALGVRGLLLKEAPMDDLVRAIEVVASGELYVDPLLAASLARAALAVDTELSDRERRILRMLADGYTNEQIARELFLSPETIRTQVHRAMTKLGAATRTQAVANALRQELIS